MARGRRTDWPKMGIFAQRSKDRPKRTGITICTLLFVQGLEIRLSEPDAVDDTPLLDVKPYLKGLPRAAKYANRPGLRN
jgi:tRNA (Thr-GGU) A37 N-methylase